MNNFIQKWQSNANLALRNKLMTACWLINNSIRGTKWQRLLCEVTLTQNTSESNMTCMCTKLAAHRFKLLT